MSDVIYVCPLHLAYPATSVKSRGVYLMLGGRKRVPACDGMEHVFFVPTVA